MAVSASVNISINADETLSSGLALFTDPTGKHSLGGSTALDADKTLVEEDHCTCSVARLVIIKRLRPTQTISGNGGGGRAG
ncbi:hypothetical protein LCGC14_2841200 [marine sediment metagenome]|uniref:Uncharacterized protein n=1 Tax=marine sediment metagenome TaxID=412755 RepID=A0A0F9B290_9ZZZZ